MSEIDFEQIPDAIREQFRMLGRLGGLKAAENRRNKAAEEGIPLGPSKPHKRRDPSQPLSKAQELGRHGEYAVGQILSGSGRRVRRMHRRGPYDLLVDGEFRVEVKSAEPQDDNGSPVWKFNIHRHGKVVEETDFYILRLEKVPFTKAAIHLLLRAPLGTPTVNVSFRSLLNKRSREVADFYAFAKGQLRKEN